MESASIASLGGEFVEGGRVYRFHEWCVVVLCVVALNFGATLQMKAVLNIEELTPLMFLVPVLIGSLIGIGLVQFVRGSRYEKELRDQLSQQAAEVRRLNNTLQERVERRTTELRDKEAALVQSQKMEAIARLAGGVAHDFNNLLTAILQGSELIIELSDEPESVRELSEDVRDAARRATELTGKLLALSHRRRASKEPRPVELAQVLRELSRLIHRMVGERVEVSLDVAAQMPSIVVDPTHLEQVVVNLCVNARDAMPDGGALSLTACHIPSQELAVERFVDQGFGAVCLRVQDSGTGIPDEIAERIFEPLFTTKEVGAGTGLGLSIVHSLMEASGGVVRLKSPEVGGALFELFWPAQPPEVEAESVAQRQRAASQKSRSPASRAMSILVIDDDHSVRQVVSRTLKSRGHLVTVASGGEAAEKLVSEATESFDVILSDIHMPGRTGIELVPLWHAAMPDAQVVLMTGFTDRPLNERRLEALKVSAVLRKPFNLSQLEDALCL